MNQYVQEALELTKQLIEAATPIAKQAYEIGLLTLQIDAAQTVVFAIVVLVASFFAFRKIFNDYKEAKRKSLLEENKHKYFYDDPTYLLPAYGVIHGISTIVFLILSVGSVLQLLSLWMWVKLFTPELWLAHQAIEKLIK